LLARTAVARTAVARTAVAHAGFVLDIHPRASSSVIFFSAQGVDPDLERLNKLPRAAKPGGRSVRILVMDSS